MPTEEDEGGKSRLMFRPFMVIVIFILHFVTKFDFPYTVKPTFESFLLPARVSGESMLIFVTLKFP
jgi:hypothetical protein